MTITWRVARPVPSNDVAIRVGGLLPHELSEYPTGGGFACVDGSVGAQGDALGKRSRDRAAHDTVLRASVQDALFVLDIRHVDRVVGSYQDSAGAAELFPLVQERALLIEDLDPAVAAIRDEQPAARIRR